MVFPSPFPDVDIPDGALTPYVLERAAELGDKPALVDGPTGRTLTYRELDAGVRAFAAGLAAARGFGRGDVFALFMPNLPEYAVAFHGVSLAGGTNTTINSLYTPDEIAFQLRDAGARWMLTIPQFLDRALPAAVETGVEVFVLGQAEGATPFAELMATGEQPPPVEVDPAEDVVTLPYSSGTTGLPKGVMLTHRNLVANLAQCDGIEQVGRDEVLIGVLPFFHSYGQTVILNFALRKGGTIVTMPRFDLEQFLGLVQEHRITRAHLVPPIVLGLAKHPAVERYDLSSLRVITSGAAPLGADLQEAAADRLGCVVKQGYGLTETSPVTHINPDDPAEVRLGSVGVPIPNTECRVVDPATGADLGVGEDGEIWIRGPQVMKGYLNRPEESAWTVDADGWLHSGDIGHVDADGYFSVVDRLKELIKYKGFQVPPAELEALLQTHPAVADAAVIPVPDEEAGEIPKAYVVLRGELTEDELMASVAERVAPHKKVRRVGFVEEIPKSASGKILRRVLVDRERASAS
jgi:acyl-CoA synthetase (AMP-forming)/AMP-acid ligase II